MRKFLASTVGKKYVMGVSGLVWAAFVLGHMAGNLLIFVSADAYNAYGHIVSAPPLIYLIESVLILALVAHVVAAYILTIQNREAKGSRYEVTAEGEKAVSLASRTMAAQGFLILAFLIYHLMTFKYGPYYPTTVDGVEMRDFARLLLEVFHKPGYVVWYITCLICLGFHLQHGFGSTFQSLGILQGDFQSKAKKLSLIYSVVVVMGFISLPIYVFLVKPSLEFRAVDCHDLFCSLKARDHHQIRVAPLYSSCRR